MPAVASKSVFNFNDFREFLKYRFSELKAYGFSHRTFSQDAGFNSPNYLKLVMDGKRGISDSAALKFGRGLGLSDQESEYLMLLCSYNQTEIPLKKKIYFDEMKRIRESLGIIFNFVEVSD